MIDENRLIEFIKCNYIKNPIDACDEGRTWAFDAVLEWIEELQKETSNWIPIEERLPEPSLNSVIGWDAYRERCVFVQYYMNEWILGNHESVKIIAWMPVPEPYKKENL